MPLHLKKKHKRWNALCSTDQWFWDTVTSKLGWMATTHLLSPFYSWLQSPSAVGSGPPVPFHKPPINYSSGVTVLTDELLLLHCCSVQPFNCECRSSRDSEIWYKILRKMCPWSVTSGYKSAKHPSQRHVAFPWVCAMPFLRVHDHIQAWGKQY